MASNDFIIRIVLDAQSKIAPVMAAAASEADKLRDRFKGADRAAADLDKRMVQLEGHVSRARDTMRSMNPTLDALDRKAKGLSASLTGVNRNMVTLERQSAKAGAALGALGGLVERLEKKLNQLDEKMTVMGAKTYRPEIEIQTNESEAKVNALARKLLKLEREKRKVKIGIEQKMLDEDIAEVERKLDNIEGGFERYVEIKLAVDEESLRLMDEKAAGETKKHEERNEKQIASDRRKYAERSRIAADFRRELDAELQKDADARARDDQKEIDRKADSEARRHDRELQAEREATRERQRIADEARRKEESEDRAFTKRYAEILGERAAQARKASQENAFGSSKANKEFLELRRLIAANAGIDIPLGVKLDDTDLAFVEAKLAAYGLRRIDIKAVVDIDRSNFDRVFRAIGSQLEGFTRRFNTNFSGLSTRLRDLAIGLAITFAEPLLSALTAVAGALIAVGVAAGQAAVGLVGLAIAAAAQATPAIGLLVLALTRVAAVVKVAQLAQQERDKGAQQGARVDNQRANALDSLASAYQGVADAQRRLIDAQDALNDARRDGVRTITDLMLAEQRATLAAQRSRLGLASAIASGSGGLIQEAQLQARGDTINANRQRVDTGRAVAGGVSGLPAVQSAARAVEDATRGIADAQKQVEQAKRGLAQATASMGAAASAYAIALGKLSEGERILLGAVERFKAVFAAGGPLRDISDIIIKSFAEGLDGVTELLKDSDILAAFTELAEGIGAAVESMARFLTTGPMKSALAFFSREAADNVGTVGSIFQKILGLLTNIGIAAAGPLRTALRAIDEFLGNMVERTSGEGGERLAQFFEKSLKPMGAFLELFGAIFELFLALAGPGGAADEGTRGIEGLTKSVQSATRYVRENGTEVRKFFRDAIDTTGHILKAFVAVGKALVEVFDPESVKLFSQFLQTVTIPVLASLVKILGFIVRGILSLTNTEFGTFLLQVGTYALAGSFALKILLGLLGPLYTAVKLLGVGLRLLAGFFIALNAGNPFAWAAVAVGALVALYTQVEWFRDAVNGIFNWLKDHWKLIPALILGPAGMILSALLTWGDDLYRAISGPLGEIADFIGGIAGTIFSPLKGAFDEVMGWADSAFGGIKKVLGLKDEVKTVKMDLTGLLPPVDEAVTAIQTAIRAKEVDAARRRGGMRDAFESGSGTVKPKVKKQQVAEPFDFLTVSESKLSPEEASAIKKLWQEIAASARVSTDKIAKSVRDMRVGIETTLNRLVRIGDESFADFWSAGNKNFDKLEASISNSMDKIVKTITTAMQDIALATYQGFKYVVDTTNESLKAFDAPAAKVSLSAPSIGEKKADGGWIGMPGERGRDAIHAVLGRGEAVLNATHQSIVEPAMNAFYGYGLTDLFKKTKGYHAGGAEQMGYAGGGFTGPLGTLAGFTPVANFAKSKFGLTMTSGRRNTITSSGNPSDHNWGGAGDFSNGSSPTPGMDGFNAFFLQRLPQVIKQLIWRNKDQQRGFTVGGHMDHVHLALLRQYAMDEARMARLLARSSKGLSIDSLLAGAVDGEDVDHVNTPKVKGSGAGRDMVRAVLKAVTRAANKNIDSEAGADRGNIGDGPNDINDANFTGPWVERMSQIAESRKWNFRDWQTLVNKESSGNPKAVNPSSGAFGLGQFLGSTKDAYAKFGATSTDPVRQIEAMAKYIADRYGNPSSALAFHRRNNWYNAGGIAGGCGVCGGGHPTFAHGGFAGGMEWGGFQAAGGDYLVNKPTMFVAGDKGMERATFTPLAKGKAPEGFRPVGSIGDGDVSGLLGQLFNQKSKLKLTERARRITQLLSELTEGQLEDAEKQLLEAIRGADKGSKFRKALNKVRDNLRRYLNDPVTILAAELSRIEGVAEIKPLTDAIRRVNIAVEHISVKNEKSLDKLSKSLDFLASDQGPFQLLEQKIQARATRAARELSKRIFKIDKGGNARRVNLSVDAQADAEVAALEGTRESSQDERKSIQRLVEKARAGLKNARTPAQRQRLRGSLNSLLARRDEVEGRIQDTTQQIVERRERQQADNLGKANSGFDLQRTGLDLLRRVNSARGNDAASNPLFDIQAQVARKQIEDLKTRLIDASATGNNELADTIRAQMAELEVSIVELASQRLAATISEINRQADRRDAAIGLRGRLVDLQERAGDRLGALRARGGLLGETGRSLEARRASLLGALGEAQAQGNVGQIEALTDQIAELDVQLAENTQAVKDNVFAIRKLSTDIITGGAQRAGGLISQGGNILTTLATAAGGSTIAAQQQTLTATAGVLSTEFQGLVQQIMESVGLGEFGAQGSNILSQIVTAAQQGPTQLANTVQQLAPIIAAFEATLGTEALPAFQALIDGIIGNTVATVENTTAMAQLNGSVAQTFSSSAWTTFRQAIFTGNGGLLPQYDIPQMHVGGYVTRGGVFELTPGERVLTPEQQGSYGIGELNVNITNPTETADPSYIGKRIAWEIAGAGRN